MAKKKQITFDDEMKKNIQQWANNNCDGNFNEAVRQLCSLGLLV